MPICARPDSCNVCWNMFLPLGCYVLLPWSCHVCSPWGLSCFLSSVLTLVAVMCAHHLGCHVSCPLCSLWGAVMFPVLCAHPAGCHVCCPVCSPWALSFFLSCVLAMGLPCFHWCLSFMRTSLVSHALFFLLMLCLPYLTHVDRNWNI